MPDRRSWGRWLTTAVLCASSAWIAWPRFSGAQDLVMPAALEARLSGSAAAYDRTLANRARGKVVIAVLANASETDSTRAAAQMEQAFAEVGTIGGLPHEQFVLHWTDASTLAETCARRNVSMLFVTPRLDAAIDAIVKALQTCRALSVAGSLAYVDKGIVLGFDLVSGRPKLVVNLTAARRQRLEFRADLLRLARVVQ